MALSAGYEIGPYRIMAAIGAGGMGEVYRGRDTKLDRDTAIKVCPRPSLAIPNGNTLSVRIARLAHLQAA